MTKLWIVLGIMIILFIAGIGLGYKIANPSNKPFVDKPPIYLHDTSVVLKVVTDTVLKDRLVRVPGTQVASEGSITILPGRSDTLTKIEVRGDTVYVYKTVGLDTIELQFAALQDQKDGTIRMQFKAKNGIIVGGVTIPRKSLKMNPLNNNIGILGTFAPKDGTTMVGVFYNKGIGPFSIGGIIETQINHYDNISIGLQTGLRF